MESTKTPNPGSDEARLAGCTCPVLSNGHGVGWMGRTKDENGTIFVRNKRGLPTTRLQQGEKSVIIRKQTRDKYIKKFDERYDMILEILTGRQATVDDSKHGTKGPGFWPREFIDNAVIIDGLDLTLAIDDLMAILKELKKLR